LPKKLRLPLRTSGSFFIEARRFGHQWFNCWYKLEPGSFQASIIVSKQVSTKAVDRNELKRRVRNILQHLTPPNGVKTVFVMKRISLRVPREELAAEIQKTLLKITKQPHENTHHRTH